MKKLLSAFLLALLATSLHAQTQASLSTAGTVVSSAVTCATSSDGSVVGIGNPLVKSVVGAMPGSGTLPAGKYYVTFTFYDFTGKETLKAPETLTQLTGTGRLSVAVPVNGIPTGAAGMRVYIGAASGTETLQGQTAGSANFLQSIPLLAGAALPATNTTACGIVANDALWPTGTGYNVALTDSSGNSLPGYPMMWQLMGPGTTINLSSGLPYYNGIVMFPTPILASPLNHGTQSISGPLNLGVYGLTAGSVTSAAVNGTLSANAFYTGDMGAAINAAAASPLSPIPDA